MEPTVIVEVGVMIPRDEWEHAGGSEDDRPSNEEFKQLLIQGLDLDTYEILEWFYE